MNNEIRERIDQIDKGIVPKVYKKTNVGIIPEDWEFKKLGDISINGGKYGINAPSVPYNSKLPTYLRITDISNNGEYINEDKKSVKDKDYEKFILEKNDIVFARTGNTTGKTYLYKENDGQLVYAGYLIKFSIDKELANSKYIYNHTKTNVYDNWVKVMSVRSGQPGINSKEYQSLEIPMPPLKEQEKIADILSLWDKSIEKTEKLIKEKEIQKKGLMQELLTGETRLPGFNGEWEEVKLGEVLTLQGGYAFKSDKYLKVDGIPIIRISNIQEGIDLKNNIVYYEEINIDERFIVRNQDLLIAMSGATTGKTAVYKEYETAYLNQRVGKFIPEPNKLCNEYLIQIVNTELFSDKMATRLVAGAQPNISGKDIETLNYMIPSLAEQVAIADILSTSDQEIELLKQLLYNKKQEKKGLMQVLLTGIVRV